MKLRSSCPAVASTSMSMCGCGNESFGHALLRSVKSMQTRHLTFFFFTTITFASQSGYWTLPTDTMLISFWISSLITWFLSGVNFLLFYLTSG